MTKRKATGIVRFPHPVLRQKAEPVAAVAQEVRDLAALMTGLMADLRGAGLAAPQIGASVRLVAVGPVVAVNPEIVDRSDETVAGEERCLSLPGRVGRVRRHAWVHVRWTDLHGRDVSQRFHGMDARVWQHEIDHLDGVLFIDKLERKVSL